MELLSTRVLTKNVVVVQSSIQHHIQNPFFIFIFSKKSSADMTSQKYVESEMPLTEEA